MSGVNKVIIVGYMGNEPDVRTLPNGAMTATISVATSEKWTDKVTGEKRESTERHRIVLWEKQAEVMAQYGHKGTQVYVEGSLRTRKWQDQNGQDRYTTEIKCSNFQFLGGTGGEQTQAQVKSAQADQKPQAQAVEAPQDAPQQPPQDQFDDNIPF